MISTSTSYKNHFKIGLFGAFWLTLFLVFIGPFDTADLSITWRAEVMYVYGFILLAAYMVMIPVQNFIFMAKGKWNWWYESLTLIFVYSLSLTGSFVYYKSDIINGDFSFSRFVLEIFLPTALILFPLLSLGRWYFSKADRQKTKKTGKNLDDLGIDLDNWKLKIETLLKTEIYLNAELSLKLMADELQTNSSVLSKIINEGYGLNFNDFINQYRIQAVIKSIDSGKHIKHTFQGIAEDCGFSSKATFNRAFKKQMGISPSEYIARK
jgi:AraC-like DNA-binding protein